MKTKILVASLLVFGLVASMAVAAPTEKGHGRNGSTTSTTSTTSGGPGKSKGKAKQACKSSRSVVLRGEFVASGAGGFAMDVKGGNKVGKSLVGKQVTVLVDEHTKLRRHGKAELADFVAGDRLKVQGKACRVDAVAMTVLARRVVGKPATAEHDGETSTTTTTTSTTETSTTETDATGE